MTVLLPDVIPAKSSLHTTDSPAPAARTARSGSTTLNRIVPRTSSSVPSHHPMARNQ